MRHNPIHVEVKPKPGESFEKLLRRFTKKCKKLEITRKCYENSFFVSKGQKRRDKVLRNKFLREKLALEEKTNGSH